MNDLQKLFVDAMSSELMKHMIQTGDDLPYTEGELDGNIKLCLELMATVEREEGAPFDHAAYSLDTLHKMATMSDENAILEAFQEYCHFEVMVSLIREFPELSSRFRAKGLDGWTRLRVDMRTLRPFAEDIMTRLKNVITNTEMFSTTERVEAAEFLNQVTDLFRIPLTPDTRALLEWCFEEQGIMTAADHTESDEGGAARVLN